MHSAPQVLPNSGPERELLREKGQFWTPAWIADAMVAYVLGAETDHVFDPAVGAGAFLAAAKKEAAKQGRNIFLLGTEIDASVLKTSEEFGLDESDLNGIEIRDFVLDNSSRKFCAIVANPPYIRHHRLPAQTKLAVQNLAKQLIGKRLDGRTGYHVFFLIKALSRLTSGGRLAFIMPSDTCEGIFAPTLWNWIFKNYCLEAAITFSPTAAPFPKVDTNALIFMISANVPTDSFLWCQCREGSSPALQQWVTGGFPAVNSREIQAVRREANEALLTGLSRPPQKPHDGPVLGDFLSVMRGIATGDNSFFFMTRDEAMSRQLPLSLMVRAVGRTRDILETELNRKDLEELEKNGRPTYLLSLDGRPISDFPKSVRLYLEAGEENGICDRPLIRQRHPWYRMEIRKVPPFLFAYLGRRNARFIRNQAGAVPLTGFLCVYPRYRGSEYEQRLWNLLTHKDTGANLFRVAKTYGSGAIKVEPRSLERVPITQAALRESGLVLDSPHRQDKLRFA